LPEAICVLNQLAEKSSYRPDLTVAVAELMSREGASKAAAKLLEAALIRSPAHFELWLQKAQQHKNYDDIAAETQTWQEMLARFPARRWAGAIPDLVRLGLLESMQDALNVWRAAEPGNPEPWWAALRVAKETKNYSLALQHLIRIEALRGPSANVYVERAAIFQEQWKLSDAIVELRKAIKLRPDVPDFYEKLLNIEVKAGNFDEFDELMAKLEHMLGDHRYLRYANFFFNINCHPTWSAAEVWRFYRDWYVRSIKPDLPIPIQHKNTSDPTRRLRIGYVSPDFHRHAVAYFSEPLLIKHDREQFELFAYAHLDPNQADQYTERYKSYFHHWTEIRCMSDDELERRIRDDGIDILVDLAGHTSNHRLKLFIRKPAPIQASYVFGAGQTTGLPEVDYLICDTLTVPPEHEDCIAEKVKRLPFPGLFSRRMTTLNRRNCLVKQMVLSLLGLCPDLCAPTSAFLLFGQKS
jgi:tetratricopeptide (TPR) repeat protein